MEMLDTSNASFWAHENLLEPQSLQQHNSSLSSAQQQSAHHLFPAHPAEAAVLHPEEVCLELGGYGTCGGAFPQTVQQHHTDSLQGSVEDRQFMPSLNALPEFSGRDAGVNPTSARKLHKADRERLRRDHLNEQFAKLAGVLDPVRPKNDKGTILSDSISAVNELRAEIECLKTEQVTLSDESRDLGQEKSELREEKRALETETDRLQIQLKQNIDAQNVMPGWMGMDLSGLMSAPQYSYAIPATLKPSKDSSEVPATEQMMQHHTSVPNPSPVLSIPTPGPFLHPAFQAYSMFGAGQAGPLAYMPYAHFPHAGHHASHIERPYARYPSPIHPTPVYAVPVPKIAQTTPAEAPGVVTDLQLQTPGVPPATPQPPIPATEKADKETSKGFGSSLDASGDPAVGSKSPTAGGELIPQLSLSSNSIAV